MEKRAENMENIQLVSENQIAKEESFAQQVVTVRDILNRIDKIIEQGEQYTQVVWQIHDIPVNDSPCGGYDGAERAKTIGSLYAGREVTNQKMIDLLNRMYDDMKGTKTDHDMKAVILDQLSNRNFMGVEPGAVKEIMDFYRELM